MRDEDTRRRGDTGDTGTSLVFLSGGPQPGNPAGVVGTPRAVFTSHTSPCFRFHPLDKRHAKNNEDSITEPTARGNTCARVDHGPHFPDS